MLQRGVTSHFQYGLNLFTCQSCHCLSYSFRMSVCKYKELRKGLRRRERGKMQMKSTAGRKCQILMEWHLLCLVFMMESARYREHFWAVQWIDNFCTWWMGRYGTVGGSELTSYIIHSYVSFEEDRILFRSLWFQSNYKDCNLILVMMNNWNSEPLCVTNALVRITSRYHESFLCLINQDWKSHHYLYKISLRLFSCQCFF